MKKLTLFFVLCVYSTIMLPQNITNTLGANGEFKIKDASNNYLILDQSTGLVNILRNLGLANTTSENLGVIFKGSQRFIHNFGANNTFIGINSGNFTTTGTYNTAVGDQSLFSNAEGNYNAAFGVNALFSNTSGERNTALGIASLYSNKQGYENTAIGNGSLSENTIGDDNTAVGNQSLGANVNGALNTALGYHSLYNNIDGNGNTAIGCLSGSILNGGINVTCLGYNAQPYNSGSSNEITLGDNNVLSLRCNVTTITSLSDARDKKNIKDLDLGIDFLMKIRPRQFNWDRREWYDGDKSDGSKMKQAPNAGFIAQELDEAQVTENAEWLNLVLKDNPERWEATPGNLLPIMVKAIQDLKKENDELIVQNEHLQAVNDELKSTTVQLTDRLTRFEQIQNVLAAEIERLKTNNNETVKVSLGEK